MAAEGYVMGIREGDIPSPYLPLDARSRRLRRLEKFPEFLLQIYGHLNFAENRMTVTYGYKIVVGKLRVHFFLGHERYLFTLFIMHVCTAIVLVTPMSTVDKILLGAARLGLTDGQRAFIHLDTRTALNASVHLAMSVPFNSRSNSSTAERLMTAAQSLLIVKAHAASLINGSTTPYKVWQTRHACWTVCRSFFHARRLYFVQFFRPLTFCFGCVR